MFDRPELSVLVASTTIGPNDMKALALRLLARRIIFVQSAQEAVQLLCRLSPDLLLADLSSLAIDGVMLTKFVRHSDRSPDWYMPVVLLGGKRDEEAAERARNAGANEVLPGSISFGGLYREVKPLLRKATPFVRTKTYFGPDRRQACAGCREICAAINAPRNDNGRDDAYRAAAWLAAAPTGSGSRST